MILFIDEKLYVLEELHNFHDSQVYATNKSALLDKSLRAQKPLSVMVFVGVSFFDHTKLTFISSDVKINALSYSREVLQLVIKSLNSTLFEVGQWTLQQGLALADNCQDD